jgi:hypothetical protein
VILSEGKCLADMSFNENLCEKSITDESECAMIPP